MKLIKFLVVFFVSIFMSSCTYFLPSITSNMSNVSIPSRDFLLSDKEPKEYDVRGYALLTFRSGSEALVRDLRFCDSFLRNLDDQSEMLFMLQRNRVVPTYWLLNMHTVDVAKSNGKDIFQLDCADYIRSYDYPRAKLFLSKAELLDVRGPVLLALDTTSAEDNILYLDLSEFDEKDFDRVMRIWKTRVCKNPLIWNKGFKYEKVKEEIRNFLQKYGEQIVGIISA